MRARVLAFVYALWIGGCLYPSYHVAPDGGTAGTAGPGAGGKGGTAAGTAGAGGSGGAAGAASGGTTGGAAGSAGIGGASGTGAVGSAGRGGAAGSQAGSGGASAGQGGATGGTGGGAGVGGGSGGRGGSSGIGGGAAGAGGSAAGAGGSTGAGGSNTGRGGGGAAGGGAGGGGTGGGTVIQSWTFNVSGDADFNAVDLSAADATKTWVGGGNPSPGSVQIGITFSPADIQLAAGVVYFADLRGVVLSAQVQLVSGFSANYPGYAFMYAKSGTSSLFANGPPQMMKAGSWIRPTMKLDDPAADSGGYASPGYDPSQIVELGVAFEDPTAHATAATVLVDTIELTRTP